MATCDELVAAEAGRHQGSSRAERARSLDEFVAVTGLHRKHAMRLLRGGQARDRSCPRPGRRTYDEAVRAALLLVWEASDRVCGKRLRDDEDRIQGCVRLLPTIGPTMLRDTFPLLLDGQPAPASDTIWESSRFGVDLCSRDEKTGRSIATATFELFAGMIEFGLMRQLTEIVTVTDARMERILCRARWPFARSGRS